MTESGAAELDLYVDTTNREAVTEVRAEIGRYLRRRAADLGQIPDAELVVAELLADALRPVTPGSLFSGRRNSRTCLSTTSVRGSSSTLSCLGTPTLPAAVACTSSDHLADRLTGEARRADGMEVSAVLPVELTNEVSFDPPRRERIARSRRGWRRRLPEEGVSPVQLAQTVEAAVGPSAAEAAVAQVGATSEQMEAAYRAKSRVVNKQSPQQPAECYLCLSRRSTATSTPSSHQGTASSMATGDAPSVTPCATHRRCVG